MTKGVPFKRIEKLIVIIRHAATSVPTGKKIDDANLKNPAGETANSSVEIFTSGKAGILRLDNAAEEI